MPEAVLVAHDLTKTYRTGETVVRALDGVDPDLYAGEVDTTSLPSSAVFRDGARWAVLGLEDGRARLREVVLGRRAGLRVEVLSGVAPGDLVIVHQSERVLDGTRVRAR